MKILVTIEPASVARKVRGVRRLIEGASRVVLAGLGLDDTELSILLTDDPGIRELNAGYRHKDRATDVLSFPMGDEVMLGDVVISLDTAVRQAAEFGVSVECELHRLLVHGVLHLIGYDHTTGGWQARRMRAREEELLAALEDRGGTSKG